MDRHHTCTSGTYPRHTSVIQSETNKGQTLTHGQLSGTLNAQVTRLAGAGSYEVHITKDDPKVESNWQHAVSSVTSTHILVTGLIPGQSYWLRIRGLNSNGGGVWSDLISIIVV